MVQFTFNGFWEDLDGHELLEEKNMVLLTSFFSVSSVDGDGVFDDDSLLKISWNCKSEIKKRIL